MKDRKNCLTVFDDINISKIIHEYSVFCSLMSKIF